MVKDLTPVGARIETIEDWLRAFGDVRESDCGFTVVLTPDLLSDYAEWVAACQRECIAQVLETMPEGMRARHCADFVRQMRGEH
jgi:hypothetical protein